MSMKKIGLTLVGVALVAMLFVVPTAKAQTPEIDALRAQVDELLKVYSSTAGGTYTSGMACPLPSLSMESTGAGVSALQNILVAKGYLVMPPGVATGYFGNLTKTALMAWQSAVGVDAIGVYGPASYAKCQAMIGTAPVTPGPSVYPVGCTSMSGYSTVTGLSCAGSSSTVPGCTSMSGFSPVNGMKCDGSSTGGGNTGGGNLQGGAGDITVTERSSGVQDEVNEGEEDVQVLGFEVEADGSDVEVTSVRVEFMNEGSGSDNIERYMDEVSIWMGSEEVGRVSTDDFSESSDVYSRNIPVSGVIVSEDETERLYVAVTASSNVDSDDLSEDWEVALGQIRFEDATGAILTDNTGTGVNTTADTYGPISEVFTFEDLSSSGDVELKVTEDDDSVNDTHSVGIDDTSDTDGVDLLSFNLEAEGSDIFLNTMVIDVTSNSGTGVTEIANDFILEMEGEEVGTVTIDKDCDGGSDGFASSTDEAICVVVSDLDDDDVVVTDGETVSFMLVANINDVDGGFSSGDELSANITAQVIASNEDGIDADDENGDALTNSEFSGTADSSNIEFLSTGIAVTTISTDTSTEAVDADLATDDRGVFEIVFDVEAIEDDAYIEIGDDATRGTTLSNTGANFVIQDAPNSYTATTTGSITTARLTSVSGGSFTGEFVKVGAGQTARFKLEVKFDPGHTPTASSIGYRMYMYSVNFATTAANATSQQVLTPAPDYRTDTEAVSN